MAKPGAARQYLDRYAAPEAAAAEGIDIAFDHAIAIPVKAEDPAFIENLAGAVTGAGRVLAIVVINASAGDPARLHRENEALDRALRGRSPPSQIIGPGVCRLQLDRELDVVVVDRFSPARRLSPGQGVGLARKIGCDLALALRARGRLRSRWIHTTDADAALPRDYFDASAEASAKSAALVYPFWHDTSASETGEALARYEISLRYYVLGLAAAGSPYAFHTLGSALAADADAYAAVRGVPKRTAAEDFYLLGKLAKIGPVARAACAPIRLRERLSDRVPVGTGPATQRIVAARAAGEAFRLYDPRVFSVLRTLRRAAGAFCESRDPTCLVGGRESGDEALDAAYREAIAAIGAAAAFESAAAATTSAGALARRIRDWLDGFRTLKLIHAARDAGLPNRPWRDALASADFLAEKIDPSADAYEIRSALAAAE